MARDISDNLKFKRQLSAWLRSLSDQDIASRSRWVGGIDQIVLASVVRDIAHEIETCPLTIWEDDIMKASQVGTESFEGCIVPELITIEDKPQFWNMESRAAFHINGEIAKDYQIPDHPGGYYNDGIYITSRRFVHPEQRQFIIFIMFAFPDFPDGGKQKLQPYLIGYAHEINRPIAFNNPLLASLAFLSEPIVEILPQTMNRVERRRVARADRPGHETEIRRVVLRRRITGQTRTVETDREWSCRWLVGGHWRKQYYPSTGEHKPKYIAAYVKGPEDMPLKAPSTTVFVAKR